MTELLVVLSDELKENWYRWGRVIVGIPAFIGIWIWACASWGLLVGLAIGWLPAAIGATILAAIWPVLAFVALGLVLISVFGIEM